MTTTTNSHERDDPEEQQPEQAESSLTITRHAGSHGRRPGIKPPRRRRKV
jgi:hypothetical protein